MKSILIKDTTKEEREQIIKSSLDCGGGCENKEINAEYMSQYRQDRQIH